VLVSQPLALAEAAVRLRKKPGRPPLSPEERAKRADKRRARQEAELAAVPVRLVGEHGAAKRLNVTRWTVRALDDAGVIPRVRIPLPNNSELRRRLYDLADLDRLIDVWKERA
jgi:hypothetical protein